MEVMRSRRSLPCRVDGPAHQERRVRARARPIFLHAALVDFGNVDIAFLIDAEVVHAPHAAGEIPPGAPGIQEMALEVVLEHLARAAVGRPKEPVARDMEY